MKRKPWTQFDDNCLRSLYANTHNQVLADFLGRSEPAISNAGTWMIGSRTCSLSMENTGRPPLDLPVVKDAGGE
jgi:hypothetical protein